MNELDLEPIRSMPEELLPGPTYAELEEQLAAAETVIASALAYRDAEEHARPDNDASLDLAWQVAETFEDELRHYQSRYPQRELPIPKVVRERLQSAARALLEQALTLSFVEGWEKRCKQQLAAALLLLDCEAADMGLSEASCEQLAATFRHIYVRSTDRSPAFDKPYRSFFDALTFYRLFNRERSS